jgi:hypothetical protein
LPIKKRRKEMSRKDFIGYGIPEDGKVRVARWEELTPEQKAVVRRSEEWIAYVLLGVVVACVLAFFAILATM